MSSEKIKVWKNLSDAAKDVKLHKQGKLKLATITTTKYFIVYKKSSYVQRVAAFFVK